MRVPPPDAPLDRLPAEWRDAADWMMGSTNPDEWQRSGAAHLRRCADELEAVLAALRVPEVPSGEKMKGGLQHGRECPKVEHLGTGYLHAADDDRPYDVDGVSYCGRCHGWLGALRVTHPRATEDADEGEK